MKGDKIVTALVGAGVQFDECPNEEVSGKRGQIKSVRTKGDDVIYTILMFDTDKLLDWTGNRGFRVIQPGVGK